MAQAKAGESFVCVCCKGIKEQYEATHDPQLGGPVCEECRRDLLAAVHWLKKEGIDRPVVKSDVNEHNYKRFIIK